MSEQELFEIGFPIMIGGTKVDEQRVTGPPARMLPALRDLGTGTVKLSPRLGGEQRPVVTVELDLATSRKTGIISSSSGPSRGDESLVLRTDRGQQSIKLSSILAFRVLEVAVPAPALEVQS